MRPPEPTPAPADSTTPIPIIRNPHSIAVPADQYQLGIDGGNAKNGPYTLMPHCGVEIQYTTTAGSAKGTWRITDRLQTAKTFNYTNQNILTGWTIYIAPGGNTGAVLMNEPANGDITITGDNW